MRLCVGRRATTPRLRVSFHPVANQASSSGASSRCCGRGGRGPSSRPGSTTTAAVDGLPPTEGWGSGTSCGRVRWYRPSSVVWRGQVAPVSSSSPAPASARVGAQRRGWCLRYTRVAAPHNASRQVTALRTSKRGHEEAPPLRPAACDGRQRAVVPMYTGPSGSRVHGPLRRGDMHRRPHPYGCGVSRPSRCRGGGSLIWGGRRPALPVVTGRWSHISQLQT